MCEKSNPNNTDLYNFRFSDRDNERLILRNFLSDNKDKILWIKGVSGAGKSFFVKNCRCLLSNYKVVEFENNKNMNSGDCLLNILDQLESLSNNKLLEFFKKNYSFFKVIKTDIQKFTGLKLSEVLEYILSKNYTLVDDNKNINDLSHAITRCINKIFSDTKLLFVIDNIGSCDPASFEALIDITKANISNKYRRFIFISTQDDNEDFNKKIEMEIPYKELEINEIPIERFMEMLPENLDITDFVQDDIHLIYNYCEGYPERLKTLLYNLNRNHSVLYENAHMIIRRDELIKYIRNEGESLINVNNFNIYEKFTLLVIVCVGRPLQMNLILEISRYCYKEAFGIAPEKIGVEIDMLKLTPKPLTFINDNNKIYLYTDHDFTFDTLVNYFININYFNMTNSYIFNYIFNEQNNCEELCELKNDIELKANLAYNSKQINWILYNYQCGKHYYEMGIYSQAVKYLNRFLDCIDKLDDYQKLICGISNYETGHYKFANSFFNCISPDNLIDKYKYFVYAGKTLNMNNLGIDAKLFFDKAELNAEKDSDAYIYAKYMQHLTLTQLPDGWDKAKQIYKDLVNSILEAQKTNNKEKLYQLSNAKLLKCCYNFYYGKSALELYEIAEKIANHFGNDIEKAYIYHNWGFEYIRENNNSNGYTFFKKSYDILKNVKMHEAAYCLNNLGICKMFDQDYPGAISCFNKALIYHKSYYVELTSRTMLMQCYRLTSDIHYDEFKSKLSKIICQNIYDDPAIIRKVCMNLLICEYEDGMLTDARNYYNRIKDIVSGTSSEYRADYYNAKINNTSMPCNNKYAFEDSKYFNNHNFEPWFITLSHD